MESKEFNKALKAIDNKYPNGVILPRLGRPSFLIKLECPHDNEDVLRLIMELKDVASNYSFDSKSLKDLDGLIYGMFGEEQNDSNYLQ